MAKFILSVGDGTFTLLEAEAKRRDITVQQLLRAVIVPEWARENLEVDPSSMGPRANPPPMPTRGIAPHLMRESIYPGRDQLLQTPVNRLRP